MCLPEEPDIESPQPADASAWHASLPTPGRMRHLQQALADARSERDRARGVVRSLRAERDDLRHERDTLCAERDDLRSERDTLRAERDELRRQAVAASGERDGFQAHVREELLRAAEARAEHDASARHAAQAQERVLRDIRSLEVVTNRVVRFLHRDILTDIQAFTQLMSRYSPIARLPPIAGWALSPSGLLALTDHIETRGADLVVECGSGTSTLWMGYALKRMGRGRLIALDHLPQYADKTRALIEAHGLTDYVDVRLAPLAPLSTPRGEFSWYSFDPEDLAGQIDLLLVDGPPGTIGPHSRYPAFPRLLNYLAPDAVIVVDDVDRPDETDAIEFWLEEDNRLTRVEAPGHGIEVLELRPAPQ